MNKTVLVAGGAITVVIASACCITVAFLAKRDQENYGPLAAACEGRAVPGTAAYAPGAQARIVYFERSAATWVESNVEVPDSIRGEGVADTALVACADDESTRHAIEQCCFQRTIVGMNVPGSDQCLPRVQLARHVAVRVAATGALVAERDVYGPVPRQCNDWVGRRPTSGTFVAGEPGQDQMAPFLLAPTTYVPTPAPGAVP